MKLNAWMAAPLLVMLGLSSAQAGLCDVPFMRDGGQIQLTGSGFLALGADLAFSDVKKQGGDQCQARVQGKASVALAGLPASKPNIDYVMTVRDGRTRFQRDDGRGGLEAVQGSFDLRLLGLFSYEHGGLQEGQTFPRQDSRSIWTSAPSPTPMSCAFILVPRRLELNNRYRPHWAITNVGLFVINARSSLLRPVSVASVCPYRASTPRLRIGIARMCRW